MKAIIGGIQQVGIGNPDCYATWDWYRKAFRIDVPIFDEAASAELMLPYTGGKPRSRHAVLAMSMQGGGGIEIWQYTNRTPEPPVTEIRLGDLGIYALKIKSKSIQETANHLKNENIPTIGAPFITPDGRQRILLKDLHNNTIEVVEGEDWYVPQTPSTGGVYGVVIGVSDMDRSLDFYKSVLGYDEIIYDETGVFPDYTLLEGTQSRFRRCLITHSQPRRGPFSQWIGRSQLELVQALDRKPTRIFKNRLWGDLGFIHLCFDVQGMDAMRRLCQKAGHPFTVDSGNHFDMGEAAGHFSYIEDPDGTLIEFVEAHKIPILKSLNWYLNLKKRNPEKPLPKWMLRCLGLNRRKD